MITAIDLSQALSPESMIPILANAEVQQRLTKYLPEGAELPKSEDELRATVSSPQFQQVTLLSKMLQQMNGLMRKPVFKQAELYSHRKWRDLKYQI